MALLGWAQGEPRSRGPLPTPFPQIYLLAGLAIGPSAPNAVAPRLAPRQQLSRRVERRAAQLKAWIGGFRCQIVFINGVEPVRFYADLLITSAPTSRNASSATFKRRLSAVDDQAGHRATFAGERLWRI
jgi:hypothetical protein